MFTKHYSFNWKHLIGWTAAILPSLILAQDTNSLQSQLEPLRPLLGKTWKGTFKMSTPEKPLVDVAKWERAMNGKAVRVLHSLNDGAYCGESIIMWDPEKSAVGYHYFTSGGFMTVGTMRVEDGKLVTLEKVRGSSGAITEVRGTMTLPKNGKYEVKTEHLKDGKWEPGREATYVEDSTARVVFR